MNAAATAFLSITAILLLFVPRRVAVLPLAMGACFLPAYVGIEVGSLHFTAVRLLIAVGVLRTVLRGESPFARRIPLDNAMLAWAAWLLFSGAFHDDPASALVFRLGLLYDALGVYMLVRAFCRTMQDVLGIAGLVAIVLLPLAAAMLYEKVNSYNVFSVLGGVGETPLVREGSVRANGPFGHPVLAGTVGAVCLPMFIALLRTARSRAVLGIAASVTIVACSASSGPILSAAAGALALAMWRIRDRMQSVRWLALAAYLFLEVVMKDPAYYLIARVDLAGGSTSWYRARLIQSAIEHLPEWWLFGTDTTRHWMWVVVSWSTSHTDITSHYIQTGVWGGLPLIALFLWVLWRGFSAVASALEHQSLRPTAGGLQVWAMGASLFAHAATGLSVSYFDQSIVFLYLVLGALGSATVAADDEIATETTTCETPEPYESPVGRSWGQYTQRHCHR